MNATRKAQLAAIFQQAVRAVAPDAAVRRHVRLTPAGSATSPATSGDSLLYIDAVPYDIHRKKILVLGAGKGAAPMAAAIEETLGEHITEGLVVVKYGHALPLQRIRLAEAAHPVPDNAGWQATQELVRMARSADADTLVLCLLTGGASALTPAPQAPVTLEDLQSVTHQLLASGAGIEHINALRKHLSGFGGGVLARLCQPAQVCSLIVSDVIGDSLDVIASGPTAPDASTFAGCADIVRRFALETQLPPSVTTRLTQGLRGLVPETPKADDACFTRVHNTLVASNRQALQAALQEAQAQGMQVQLLTDTLHGEAHQIARELTARAVDAASQLRPTDAPCCLLAGGECTVTLRGHGTGGRNQEMALAAGMELEARTATTPAARRVGMLFAGTDGSDGPTDAAGGYALPDSAARLRQYGAPENFLRNNDSHTALCLNGDVYRTGPTRTNVMDIAILCAYPPES